MPEDEEELSRLDSIKERLSRFEKFKEKEIHYILDKTKQYLESNEVLLKSSDFGFALMIKKEIDVLPDVEIDDEKAQQLIADSIFIIHLVFKHEDIYKKIEENKALPKIINYSKTNGLFKLILTRYYRFNNAFNDADTEYLTRHIKYNDEEKEEDIKLCELNINYQESISEIKDLVIELDVSQLKCLIGILQKAYDNLK